MRTLRRVPGNDARRGMRRKLHANTSVAGVLSLRLGVFARKKRYALQASEPLVASPLRPDVHHNAGYRFVAKDITLAKPQRIAFFSAASRRELRKEFPEIMNLNGVPPANQCEALGKCSTAENAEGAEALRATEGEKGRASKW